LHSDQVAALLGCVFFLGLDKDEARRRRTQPRDSKLNPNPLKPEDFDDLLWPAYERYCHDRIEPLKSRIYELPSPESSSVKEDIVEFIMDASELKQLPSRKAFRQRCPQLADYFDSWH